MKVVLESAMRDDTSRWADRPVLTGQEAALAIVGEWDHEDPAAVRKAAPWLGLLRQSYEGTRRWFADMPEEKEGAPKALVISEKMRATQGRGVAPPSVKADDLYCAYPRSSRGIEVLLDEPPSCELTKETEAYTDIAGIRDVRFQIWLRGPMADFERQTFSREVLAGWMQEVGASSAHPFAVAAAQPVAEQLHETVSDRELGRACLLQPVARHQAQDAAVLAAICNAGHEPLAIPANEPGRPGVKAVVRGALRSSSLFVGKTVFDKTWERLRLQGDIAVKG